MKTSRVRSDGRWSRSISRKLPAAALAVALVGSALDGTTTARAQEAGGSDERPVVVNRPGPAAPVAAIAVSIPAAQAVSAGQPSLSVAGSGSANAPAETARIQILVGSAGFNVAMAVAAEGMAVGSGEIGVEESILVPALDGTPEAGAFGPFGLPPLTEETLVPVVRALVDAGAAVEDVTVNIGPGLDGFAGPGGPGTGLIEVGVAQPQTEQVAALIAAGSQSATDNGLFVQQLGVAYDVADCGPLVLQAQQAAIADGREQAARLADSLGVTLGDLIQAADFSALGQPFIADEEGGCPESPDVVFSGPGSAFDTPAFDPTAPAEARAFAQINLVFAFEPGSA